MTFDGFCVTFYLFLAVLSIFEKKKGVKMAQNDPNGAAKMGLFFLVILDHSGMLWSHYFFKLASFWHHFGVVLRSF